MKLILGLGNPGTEYEETRHNAGFLFLDKIIDSSPLEIDRKGYHSFYGRGRLWGSEVILAKPQTFMNLSGKAVQALFSKFSLSHNQLIVVHDELDLETGRFKIKRGGGDAGHRGIRSIAETLGTRDFYRIRLGISRPAHSGQVSDYVLAPFNGEEEPLFNQSVVEAIEELKKMLLPGRLR